MFPASFLSKCFPDIMRRDKWDKVFKNGPSKICGWQPLKKFEEVWTIQTIPLQMFEGCLPKTLLGPFLNTLSQIKIISQILKPVLINIFYTIGFFLYLLKILESLCFFYIFRGYRKRQVTWNGLKQVLTLAKNLKRLNWCKILKKRVRGGGLKDSS